MLRAVVGGDGRQRVLPVSEVSGVRVVVEDLSGCGVGEVGVRVGLMRDRLSHEVRPVGVWPLFEVAGQLLPSGVTRVYLSLDLLVADAVSVGIVLEEFGLLFEDSGVVLEPVGLSFRDYVGALVGLESGEGFARARGYWLSRVGGLAGAPQLPVRVGGSGGVATRFVRRSGGLGVGEWGRLRELAGGWGVTVSAVLLAVYAEVLGVWSKGSRFTVNVTVGDRLPVHGDVERVVGDFTSLVLVEVEVGGGSFGERVRGVQERLWADLEHRAFGGVRVMREVARLRGPAAALMPVVFTSVLGRSMPGRDGVLPGLGRLVGGVSQTPQVFLDYQVFEQGGGLVVSWDAVEAVFEPGVLDAMFGAHEGLLRRLVVDPGVWDREVVVERPVPVVGAEVLPGAVGVDGSVDDVVVGGDVVVDGDVVSGVVGGWSVSLDGVTGLPVRAGGLAGGVVVDGAVEGVVGGGLLHGGVVWWAGVCPEAVAVCGGFGSLSYGEVVGRACRVAARLRSVGVGVGDVVGVCMEKGWEQVVGVVGVLLAGAAYVPVDPGLPRVRRELLVERTGVRVVLSQSGVVSRLAGESAGGGVGLGVVGVWCVDVVGEWVGFSSEVVSVGVVPGDVAYVIFTSGSTGEPKGVVVDHRGAVNTVVDVNARFGVGVGDRVLGVSSLSFDLSVWDVFGVLSVGGTLVLPDPGSGRDPGHWVEMVGRFGVTVWNSVPALFELLVEAAVVSGGGVGSLRLVLLSGDWVPVGLAGRARELVAGVEVVSLGGATEASIWSIFHRVEEVSPEGGWVGGFGGLGGVESLWGVRRG